MGVLSELDKRVIGIGKRDSAEDGLVICAVLALSEYELEEDVQEYLEQHPDTTFEELDKFIISLCPPLEIVDDDELEDDE